MSDVIFIAATIVFLAICVLYVHWCDTIIGPDDLSADDDRDASLDAAGPAPVASVTGASSEVAP